MECRSFKSLPDMSKWDTSNAIIMGGIFNDLSSLSPNSIEEATRLEREGGISFNSEIFSECSSLIYLPDISKWNTNNVTNMFGMFAYCSSLTCLPDISKWNTNKVTNMGDMFYGCLNIIISKVIKAKFNI